MALGHHIVMRATADRVLAPTVVTRRALARSVLRVAADFRLLAMRAADTHLHLLVVGTREAAREFARRLAISLRRALDVAFAPARMTAVVDQRHLVNAFHYVLRQHARHDIASDPLFDASNLPDLLGMGVIRFATARCVSSLLPRVRRSDLSDLLGVPSLDEPRPAALGDLADAAAGAVGLAHLADRTSAAVAARRAAVHVLAASPDAALSTVTVVAAARGVGRHCVRKMLDAPVDRTLVVAVTLQLRLSASLRASGLLEEAGPGPMAGR